MWRQKIYCFLFLLFSHQAYCQVDSILALQGNEARLKGFIDWASNNIFWEDTPHTGWDKKLVILNEAYEKFNKTGDQKLIREAWFYIELWKIGGAIRPFKPGEASEQMLQAAEKAHELNWYYTEAECRMIASTIYFDGAKYGPSFQQAYKAEDIFQKLGLHEYPEACSYIAEIASRYHYFGEYETAIHLFRQAISVPEPWVSMPKLSSILNTLALCYQNLEKYDSAIYFFQCGYDYAVKTNDTVWAKLIKGNSGRVYFLTGQYDEALSRYLPGFDTSAAAGARQGAAIAGSMIGLLYARKGDITEAEKFSDFTKRYYDELNSRSKAIAWERLSEISRLKNDYKTAYNYLDSSFYWHNLVTKERDASIIKRTRQMVDIENYATQVKLLESERSVQLLIRNSVIGMSIMISIIAILLINRMRTKRNMAIKAAALEKRMMTEELEHSKKELNSFTNLLKEKNEMIETFKNSIEKIKSSDAATDRNTIIGQLTQASILTEEDWKQFRILFDKAYPGFFIRLKEEMPELTAADTRMMTLIKLQLSQKEMAAMLGIGYDAIRKARQRLRDKINLEKDGSLEAIVKMI
ncbi:MAG: tetratricopeptide repeat protein [Bacteroidota bacterium]